MELCHLRIEVITREPTALLEAIAKLEEAGNVRMIGGDWRTSVCGPACAINVPSSGPAAEPETFECKTGGTHLSAEAAKKCCLPGNLGRGA